MNIPTKPSLINALAAKYSMDPDIFYRTIKATIMPNANNEQIAAMLMVAHQYDLNPILKQILRLPEQVGGITPIISIDGWCELINRQPTFDGMEFEDHLDADGKRLRHHLQDVPQGPLAPASITEYLDESERDTDPWKTSPKRMLRHRAMIQCARYTFGLSGAFDEGHHMEIEVNGDSVPVDMEPLQRQVAPPAKRTPPPAPSGSKPMGTVEVKKDATVPMTKASETKIEDVSYDPETGEIFDPEQFLTDLDNNLETAKTHEELGTIWKDHEVNVRLSANPEYKSRAADLLKWHQDRLSKA